MRMHLQIGQLPSLEISLVSTSPIFPLNIILTLLPSSNRKGLRRPRLPSYSLYRARRRRNWILPRRPILAWLHIPLQCSTHPLSPDLRFPTQRHFCLPSLWSCRFPLSRCSNPFAIQHLVNLCPISSRTRSILQRSGKPRLLP